VNSKEVRNSLFGRLGITRNEWVVRDFDVLGVLAQPPYSVERIGRYTTLCEVMATFAPMPVFQFQDEALMRLSPFPARMEICDFYP
jgi:hypothetical protein